MFGLTFSCSICNKQIKSDLNKDNLECPNCNYKYELIKYELSNESLSKLKNTIANIKANIIWNGEIIPCSKCQKHLISFEHLSKLSGRVVSNIKENGYYLDCEIYEIRCNNCGHENIIKRTFKIEVL